MVQCSDSKQLIPYLSVLRKISDVTIVYKKSRLFIDDFKFLIEFYGLRGSEVNYYKCNNCQLVYNLLWQFNVNSFHTGL